MEDLIINLLSLIPLALGVAFTTFKIEDSFDDSLTDIDIETEVTILKENPNNEYKKERIIKIARILKAKGTSDKELTKKVAELVGVSIRTIQKILPADLKYSFARATEEKIDTLYQDPVKEIEIEKANKVLQEEPPKTQLQKDIKSMATVISEAVDKYKPPATVQEIKESVAKIENIDDKTSKWDISTVPPPDLTTIPPRPTGNGVQEETLDSRIDNLEDLMREVLEASKAKAPPAPINANNAVNQEHIRRLTNEVEDLKAKLEKVTTKKTLLTYDCDKLKEDLNKVNGVRRVVKDCPKCTQPIEVNTIIENTKLSSIVLAIPEGEE